MLIRPVIGCAAMLASAVLLCGCSSLSLYSETRDKQGEAAKKAWADVDVKAVIATQRDNLGGLLQEQLKAQERISTASRDQRIRSMVTAESGTIAGLLIEPASKELVALAGSSEALKQWLANRQYDADHLARMEKFAREFERFGFELPSCDDLKSGKAGETLSGWIDSHPNTGGFVSGALIAGKKECEDYNKGNAPLPAGSSQRVPPAGRLKAEADRVAKDEKTLEDIRQNSLAARNAYKAALGEYDAVVARLLTDADSREKVQEAAKRLQANLKLLVDASDVFSVEFLSKEKRDSLNAFLAAVADTPAGQGPPAGSSRAAMALILLPDLFDSAGKSLADAKKPLLVPLLLRKNHEQLNLEAASRDIAAQETFVELGRAKRSALTEQARQLQRTIDAIGPTSEEAKNAKVAEVGKLKSTEDRRRVFQALALYLDAQGRLAAEVKKFDYKRDAAVHERSLSLAEVNVLQWDSLVGTTVDQLADFGTTGIKSEHIAGLLNSLTLLWIGSGVNR